jgi:hypothetical protein
MCAAKQARNSPDLGLRPRAVAGLREFLRSAKGTVCRQGNIRNSGGRAVAVLRKFSEGILGHLTRRLTPEYAGSCWSVRVPLQWCGPTNITLPV